MCCSTGGASSRCSPTSSPTTARWPAGGVRNPSPGVRSGTTCRWLAGRDRAAAEEYWRAALHGLTEPTALPYDRQPVQAHRAQSRETVQVALPARQLVRLREVAQQNGLTLNTVVQGAWAVLLARLSGQRDVVFGSTGSGRPPELPGVESMIGMFINTLPTRVTIQSGHQLIPWLRDLQAAQAEARRFDFLSLPQLHACAQLPTLFDSIVVFENYPINDEAAAAHGLRVRALRAVETTNYPLSVVVAPGRELSVHLGYDPALFDRASIERIAGYLLALLAGIAENPDRGALDLQMQTAAERHRVLVEWNDTAYDGPEGAGWAAMPGGGATVPGLFAEQVRRTPDAPALVSDGAILTYAELDARTNQLANQLIRLGLRPEQPVGVLMDRSPDVVVAELAVLKAGGAYVPLDTRAPAARLRLLMAETGADILLTDSAWAGTARSIHDGHVVLASCRW